MKILIIEDEARIAKRTERMALAFFGEEDTVIFRCESLREGMLCIEHQTIDLLLLDLNLNGDDGFGMLETAVSYPFHTIIISAYTEQAIRAFSYGVLDFVPKPFDEQRLHQAFSRIAAGKTQTANQMNFLAVKKGGSIALLPVKDLWFIKGAGIYTELHFRDGKKELHDKSLEKLQQLLPSDFERIHKSYLVPVAVMDRIVVASGSRYTLLLQNGMALPIGRSRYKALRERLL